MSNPNNMTKQMKESLENLRSSLLCPLCNHLMVNCHNLGCGHSFCNVCIKDYTADNWNCPVVGCNQPVSARSSGSSYMMPNAHIEGVIQALKNIEGNIANAPERWWIKSKDDQKNNSVAQFQDCAGDDEEVLDFQQLADEEEGRGQNTSSKRKRTEPENDAPEDEDASDTTNSLDLIDSKNIDTTVERGRINITDTSIGNHIVRDRISCSVPTVFPQQFSPISMRNSQQSEPPNGLEVSGRKTATLSQIETVKKNLESNMPGSEEQKTATSSEIQGALLSANSPHSNSKDLCDEKDKANTSESKRGSSSRVSFQPRPKVMLLYPSSTLKASDSRCIHKCISDGNIAMLSKYPTGDDLDSSFDFETDSGREAFMKMLSCTCEENESPVPLSCYTISTDKDYATDDGIVVPRSFNYYLAVATGMPIIDIGFLSTFSSKKRRSSGHQQYPFPCSKVENKFQIIGASDYAWNTPQKSVAAAMSRYQSWLVEAQHGQPDSLLPGTDLLGGYDVIMLGEYDQPAHNQRAVKRKKQKQDDAEVKKTRGNLIILLQLCGAKVYDITSVTTTKQLKLGLTSHQYDSLSDTLPTQMNFPALKDRIQDLRNKSHLIAMVKDSSCVDFAERLLSEFGAATGITNSVLDKISVVTSDWLFDSIGDYEPKKIT